MLNRRVASFLAALCFTGFATALHLLSDVPAASAAPELDLRTSRSSTADHTTFEILKQKFTSGPEVTRACLTCHVNASRQLHKTKHWTWDYTNPRTGQRLGKNNVVNNFCISAAPNVAACTSCHIGYGWKDDSFDFASEENVDCLVCHDTTGTYSKAQLRNPGKRRLNLSKIARSVGPTSRQTCGSCHFSGGGGKAVKHGDIDPTLTHPDYFVDVHMDADGLNFTCSTCHTADQHAVAGSRYTPTATDRDGIDVPGRSDGGRASCESCHGSEPHPKDNHPKLNDHTDRVACQTCHIPEYSRGDFASKMWWDWSTAGRLNPDGSPLVELDAGGLEAYSSKKGDFTWEDNVVPEYQWFNGIVRYTLMGDEIDPDRVVAVNRFEGSPDDPDARIWPVKMMRGKQPYDSKNNTLVMVKTTEADGYWTTFDWEQSIALGMQAIDAPYSGEYGFVETEMTWPITHMVAGPEEALACNDCHVKDGRLQALTGFYMPGRDSYAWLTTMGWLAVVATLLGVLAHLAVRVFYAARKK